MTITKTKDFAKIFAIFAGALFLVCAVLQALYLGEERIILVYGDYYYRYVGIDAYINIFAMLLIFAGFAALCFTCKRSAALVLPIAGLAVLHVNSLISNVNTYLVSYLQGYAMDFIPFLSMTLFDAFYILSLVALFFLFVQVSINVSTKKGTAMLIICAALTAILSAIAYGAYFLGDILEFFYYMEPINYGFIYYMSYLLRELLNGATIFVYGFAVLFLSIWMIFRPKTVEVQEKEKKSKKENTEEVTEDGFIETTADDNAEAAPTEGGAAPISGEAFTEKAFAET